LILVIDNYDSFTYNLVDLLKRFSRVRVIRNDHADSEIVERLQPKGIVISPGPGRPEDSGISWPVVERYFEQIPILGVCLGHQLIARILGAEIIHASQPMHGKTSLIFHKGNSVFKGLTNPLRVMRYHSLIVESSTLPDCLEVTAGTESGDIMGIQHKLYNLAGVQFHPESVLSDQGTQMIKNWTDGF
jgi:anthranilate synthase component 2